MTRQDRKHPIADNIAYVSGVLKEVLDGRMADVIVFAGFSQGVSMAFRAAVSAAAPRRYVIAVGGDIPPERSPGELRTLSSGLICRGVEDQWYAADTFAAMYDVFRQPTWLFMGTWWSEVTSGRAR
jgi:predicted esterase